MYHKLIFILSLLFIHGKFFGQTDSLTVAYPDSAYVTIANTSMVDSVLTYAQTFTGCKYGFGSCGPKSFDCSGFVMHVYGKYGVKLPHTSGGIAEMCENVKWKKLQPGDLLFFSGRKVSKKSIGHVAIVKAVDNTSVTMIHATVQAGVLVEVYENSDYFRKRFIRAGRISVLTKD